MYFTEESTCDIVGTFRRPRSHSAPGELFTPCTPRYVPDHAWILAINPKWIPLFF